MSGVLDQYAKSLSIVCPSSSLDKASEYLQSAFDKAKSDVQQKEVASDKVLLVVNFQNALDAGYVRGMLSASLLGVPNGTEISLELTEKLEI